MSIPLESLKTQGLTFIGNYFAPYSTYAGITPINRTPQRQGVSYIRPSRRLR
jgi:hypothetical protein